MRDNVMGELQQIQPDEENKSKMLDIRKRLHEEVEADSLDEDETDSCFSEDTIQKILSGAQLSLNDLSFEKINIFQRAIASGELSKSIQPWDPWWLKPCAKHISLSSDDTQLVLPISNDESENDKWHDIPHRRPGSPLPPVSKLTSSDPSPLLRIPIHLIDVIYSYCFTLRLHNGDWKTDPLETSMVVLIISAVLGEQHQQPETVLEALLRCLEQTCSSSYKHAGGLRFGLWVLDDVIGLPYLGGNALVCLLCDVWRLVETGEREAKVARIGKTRSKLKFAERKVYFLTCWVHEQGGEGWGTLAGFWRRRRCVRWSVRVV